MKKMNSFIKTNPIPVFTSLFLLIGLFFFLVLHQEQTAHYIWLTALIGGGTPIIYQTLKGAIKGHFASDIVAMLAIIAALFLSQAFAGAIVVLMQSGGEAIERFGFKKASSSLKELLQRAPQKAQRRKKSNHSFSDTLEEINVKEVNVGDLLIVRPGEMIPVDGMITQGSSQIDESALTGEPLDKPKTIGDSVLSGSININGQIEMQSTKISKESQYEKIVRLVQKAQQEKAPIQRLADRYAVFFTPLTLIMALIGYLVTQDATTILSVLVVATPCPLILATPLAVMCGINQAAKTGIIVKGGSAIEQIASIQAILFDKTGTITYGQPAIKKMSALSQETPDTLIYAASALEQFSTHTTAKIIVQEGLKRFKTLPLPTNYQEVPGQGVTGTLGQDQYIIGSATFLQKHLKSKDFDSLISSYLKEDESLIFIAKNNQCVGIITLEDTIRPNVAQLIEELKNLGIHKIMMITGDHQKSAEKIANQANIQEFKAELLPEQKVQIAQEWKSKYKSLAMVGDGINDAPALATATVGIAMGAHGTAISAEAADIVLLIDDLTKVASAIHIGKRMLFIAKQSIFIGMGLSFILMIFASLGYIIPAIGASLQEIIDVAVILNALRVLKNHSQVK